MGLTEQRYKDIREKLDTLGYRQPLGIDSLLLVEHLLADLLHTTESLKHYKSIAQETLEKFGELQYGVEPYKSDNARLIKECNSLHQRLIEEREGAEKQQKELKNRVRTLENINTDLEFICNQHLSKIHQLNVELATKGQKILNLKGIKKNVSNSGLKKDYKKDYISSRSGSSDDKQQSSHNTYPTQVSSHSDFYKTGITSSNICNLSKNQYDSLIKELKSLKEEKAELIEEIASVKKKVATRNEEIIRLQDLLEGGRPVMAVKKECYYCSCKDCCMRSNISSAEYKLQEQLKECQELQHEAMCRAVKMAERNKRLEEELKFIKHCNCKYSSDANDDRVENLNELLESKDKEIEVLKVKLKEMVKSKGDLEADKSKLDQILEEVVEERKQLNDRVNRLCIIERDLMAEIDRLNNVSEKQRIRLVELEERLSVAEKLVPIKPVKKIVAKDNRMTNLSQRKVQSPSAHANKAAAMKETKHKSGLVASKKGSPIKSSKVTDQSQKKDKGDYDRKLPKASCLCQCECQSFHSLQSKKPCQCGHDSAEMSNGYSSIEADTTPSRSSSPRRSSSPVSVKKFKPSYVQKQNDLKLNGGSTETEKKSIIEFKDSCKEELRRAKENLIEERKKFEETIKELTQKQVELMQKLNEKEVDILNISAAATAAVEGRYSSEKRQTDQRHNQDETGEPCWVKLERCQAERDYYYKEFTTLCDQITSAVDVNVDPGANRGQSVMLILQRLLTERDFYFKEYNKLQERLVTSNIADVSGGGTDAPNSVDVDELRSKLNDKEDEILSLKQQLRDAFQMSHVVGEPHPSTLSSVQRGKIYHLEMERDAAKNDVKRLEEDREALKERLKDITEVNACEVARMEKTQLCLEEKINKMEHERRELLSNINDLNSKTRSLEDDLKCHRDEMNKIYSEHAHQRSQLSHVKMLQEQTDRALNTSQDILTQTEAELASALDRIQELERERLMLERELHNIRSDRCTMSANLNTLDQQKDALLLKVDEKTERIVYLEKELRQRDNRVTYLEDVLSDIKQKFDEAIDANKHCETETKRAFKEAENLRQELVVLERSRDHAVRENKRLHDDLSSMTQECVSTSRALENARREVEDLKMQLQGYVAEVQRVEEILQSKESERTEMLEQYRNLSEEATVLESSNHTLESEAKSTKTSLRVAEEKINDLERNLLDKDALLKGYEEQMADLTTHVAALEMKLCKQVEKKQDLECELQNLRELCSKLEKHKDTLSRHVEEIESDKAHLEKNYQHVKCKHGDLEEELRRERKNSATLENILAESRQETLEKNVSCNDLKRQVELLHSKVSELQAKLDHGNEALRRCQIETSDYRQRVDDLRREISDERLEFERIHSEAQSFESLSSLSPS
ncbi:uncharacterized protein LOC142332354 isoform X2 [Lycorma delicatula]|uniref:uncharacterized protein LOC142332354 isoform X2 n=1 Tax=Lycorma delicatula TaxID=130591 RepID=UPI003F514A7F